jgi:hypothetical protein
VRVLHLNRRFLAEQAALAPRGTPAWQAVSRTLRELLVEAVPAPGPKDIGVDLPPMVVGRPVEGTDLVVAFLPAGGEIHVLALRRAPSIAGP